MVRWTAAAAAAWLALGATRTAQATTRTCYYPSGDAADGQVPCTSDTYTHCCDAGDVCLSNGYCLRAGHQPYVLSRGGCTDSSWGDGCPGRCYGSNDNPAGRCSMVNLLYVNSTATYCCGTPVIDSAGDAIVCPNGEDAFTVDTGTMLTGVAALATSSANATAATTSATNTGTTTSATSSSTAAAATSSDGSSSSDDSSTTTTTTAVGAGLGVALGVCLLAAVSWALWERRQRTRLLLTNQSSGSGGPGMTDNSTNAGYYQPAPGLSMEEGGSTGNKWYSATEVAADSERFGPPVTPAHELGTAPDRAEMMDTQAGGRCGR